MADPIEVIAESLESAAQLHRRKAQEHPGKNQDQSTTKRLEALAHDVRRLEGSELHRTLSEQARRHPEIETYIAADSVHIKGVGTDGSTVFGADMLQQLIDLFADS